MPEGPEVRRYADLLHGALAGRAVARFEARTRAARAWLAENPGELVGRRVLRVVSRGKNLIGYLEGGCAFHSHLMMWGRWAVSDAPPEWDRRERARVEVEGGVTAVLLSAPVFEVGAGDPLESNAHLRSLGPDILPYPDEGPFHAAAFLERLDGPENAAREIGAILLDQTVLAGVGNYLRAEILFECRMDPWRRVGDLSAADLECLCRVIPEMAERAYRNGGATLPDAERGRMAADPNLVYRPGADWQTRHYVFRRTNLPCLACGGPIRQLRQTTRADEEGEKQRIIYFCPACQRTSVPLKPARPSRRAAPPIEPEEVTA